MNDWLQLLRDALCRIYVYWGGDCQDLGQEAPDWVMAVKLEYEASGPPEFASPEAKTQFLSELTALESHLADPANSLSSSDNQTLTDLIASLRSDLGVPS